MYLTEAVLNQRTHSVTEGGSIKSYGTPVGLTTYNTFAYSHNYMYVHWVCVGKKQFMNRTQKIDTVTHTHTHKQTKTFEFLSESILISMATESMWPSLLEL